MVEVTQADQIERDMAWWQAVGATIGADLVGWTYRKHATFKHPDASSTWCIDAVLANTLLATEAAKNAEIAVLKDKLETFSAGLTERDAEIAELVALLRRYVEHEFNPFENGNQVDFYTEVKEYLAKHGGGDE